tara:strand:+ start:183 stop:404 length:222 start_codon:yes stop_codon:yes gene_type:complete
MKRRFLIFFLLGFSMMEILSAQGEIMRSRLERDKEREKQRQEQKQAALPQPAILFFKNKNKLHYHNLLSWVRT